jgi:hypothetical protein
VPCTGQDEKSPRLTVESITEQLDVSRSTDGQKIFDVVVNERV